MQAIGIKLLIINELYRSVLPHIAPWRFWVGLGIVCGFISRSKYREGRRVCQKRWISIVCLQLAATLVVFGGGCCFFREQDAAR